MDGAYSSYGSVCIRFHPRNPVRCGHDLQSPWSLAVPPMGSSNIDEVRETTFCEENGRPFLMLSSDKATIIGPNGELSEHSHHSGILLACGMMWFPYMLFGKPPILVTTCAVCRDPPVRLFRSERAKHGLLSIRHARHCVRCGRTTCPRHRRACEDGWRCLACAQRATVVSLLSPIFFRKGDQ